ncbi:MAG: Rrf2 family transcriptional regulator, partial [bacterium]
LSKVIQRLAHSGLVKTVRGPGGGVTLAKTPDKITLLNVYESLEGTLAESNCLLATKKCGNKGCILGDLLSSVNKQVKTRLAGTKLSDFVL